MFGSLRLFSEKSRDLKPNMEEAKEGDKQSLLEGTQPHLPPYTPNSDDDKALFHDKGKSPKEVCVGVAFSILFARATAVTLAWLELTES